MNTPHLYQVSELVQWTSENSQFDHSRPELGWHPARPIGFQGLSLGRRLKLAWGVFTGKYDAVYWEPNLRDLFGNEGLPVKVDLSARLPEAEDQGEVNAAAACAVTAALAATGMEMGNVGCVPLLYYNERVVEEKK